MVKGYKGFDNNFKCQGFQFEVGGEYEESDAVVCEKGFHFCEFPLDVLKYYPPADSRYAIVEGDGKISRHVEDSKVACTKLRVEAEIGLDELISAGKEYILKKVDSNNHKWDIEECSAATNSGDASVATNTGNRSVATNTGNRSVAVNTGDYSTATVEGLESIAMAMGYQSKAKGALGCWIVLSEWDVNIEGIRHIIDVQCAKVDGEKIKPDTFYRLENGEFVECEHE
jgi:hypothetical protein